MPLDVNAQVPLSVEGLTHSSDWGTVKNRKVPLAPLGCGRRLGICRAGESGELQAADSSSGVTKASARQGGNADEQGGVRGFPPLICQAGMAAPNMLFPSLTCWTCCCLAPPYPTPSAFCAQKKNSHLNFLGFP